MKTLKRVFFFGGPTASVLAAAYRRSKGPESLVAPLDAILERVRWFHRQARQAASSGSPAKVKVVSSPTVESDALPDGGRGSSYVDGTGDNPGDVTSIGTPLSTTHAATTRPGRAKTQLPLPASTRTVAVQTAEAPLAVGTRITPTQSCGTQSGCSRDYLRDAEVQTLVPSLSTHSCETSMQTVATSVFGRHRSVQTELLSHVCRDAISQTEAAAEQSMNHTSSVRMLRLARQNNEELESASRRMNNTGDRASSSSSSATAGTLTAGDASVSTIARTEKAARKAGRVRYGHARGEADVLVATDTTVTSTSAEACAETQSAALRRVSSARRTSSEMSPRLRCPAGHCMQWVPTRRQDSTSRPDDLCCSVCSRPGTGGVHCCALCYRDDGERHTICSTCSRDPGTLQRYVANEALSSSGNGESTVATSSDWQMVKPSRKSSSTGCLQAYQRRKPGDVTLRACEWSQVSATLQKPPGMALVSSPGRAVLSGSPLFIQ